MPSKCACDHTLTLVKYSSLTIRPQIMDPRLDSNLANFSGASSVKFDVFAPLSSEEVCWIMDKAICAEVCLILRPLIGSNRCCPQMGWHQGHSLSQTIYTCLYFHEFAKLDPTIWQSRQPLDSSRPAPLVTSILRSWIQCMIKTCDMAWREYAQRHVYEVCLSPSFHLSLTLDSHQSLP